MNALEHNLTPQNPMNQASDDRDEALWLAAKSGCHQAFAELQRAYSKRLYRKLLAITKNHEDAEDALQDTFLRAYVGLRTFEGRARFSTWLTSIAINSALMTLRRRHSRREIDQSAISGDNTFVLDFPDGCMNPEQFCDSKQCFSAVLRAVQRLEPKMRVVIQGWIKQDSSMKELAHDLGLSTACVKARLHRARKCLKRHQSARSFRLRPLASGNAN